MAQPQIFTKIDQVAQPTSQPINRALSTAIGTMPKGLSADAMLANAQTDAGAPPPASLAVGGGDFWTAANGGQENPFPVTVAPATSSDAKRKRNIIILGVVVGLFFALGTFTYLSIDSTGENPWVSLMNYFFPDSSQIAQPRLTLPPKKVATAHPEKKSLDDLKPVNPYWLLPNYLHTKGLPKKRIWTAQEEKIWRNAMGHRFEYQHWRAAREVRRERLYGSEPILELGLDDPKFWTRMQSAMGLADMGKDVPMGMIEKTLGNARSELVSNYMERFGKNASVGEIYILKQLVKIADERGRLAILKALNRSGDPSREMYIYAATYDPGQFVQKWAKERFGQFSIKADTLDYYKTAMLKGVIVDTPTNEANPKNDVADENDDDDEDENPPANTASTKKNDGFGQVYIPLKVKDGVDEKNFKPVEVIKIDK